MTFFLPEPKQPEMARNPARGDVSTFFKGLGGAYTSRVISNDANYKLGRTYIATRDDLAVRAIARMGLDSFTEVMEERNQKARDMGMPSQVRPMPTTAQEAIETFGPNFSQEVLKRARMEARNDPDLWADIGVDEESIDAEVNRRLQAEYHEARALVDMMPGGRIGAELLGDMSATIFDVKNAPFLLLGGGAGSIGRVAAREAAANTAAEAVNLPQQFKMAERLDIPDPDVASTLAMAAVAGGALGATFEVGARIIRYATVRNQTLPEMDGYAPVQVQAMVDEAEDILASGDPDAMQKIAQITEKIPKEPPFLLENPINPERPPLVPQDNQSPQGAPNTEAQDVPSLTQAFDNDQVTELNRQADEARFRDGTAKKPLVAALRDSHKPKKDDPMQVPGHDLRIDPNGPLGSELKFRLGTNNLSQRAPGLFKRGGVKEMDNLVASEWEADYPGISRAAGISDDGMYLDPDGLIDVLVRDIEGDSTWLDSRAEAQKLDEQAFQVEAGTALGDYQAVTPAENGLFINLDHYHFDLDEYEAAAAIKARVLRYIDENDLGDLLTDVEKREIIDQLQRNGGESKYLIELIAEREAAIVRAKEQADADAAEIPFDDDDFGDGQLPIGSDPFGDAAPSGVEGEGLGRGTARATEATPAGDQTLIDGVAPVTQQDRLESQQSAPMRGGNAAADDGLFDLGARAQSDMFEPDSPKFQERTQAQSQYLRDDIEANGDIEVAIALDDGRTLRSGADALRYLDEYEEFAEIIALCGKSKGKTA